MGEMKRAEKREREIRERLAMKLLGRPRFVVLSWKTNAGDVLLNVLDNRSRLPLTRQRVLSSTAPIWDMVQRSLTGTRPSPKTMLLRKALAEGRGEVEIEITGEQYAKVVG